MIKDVAGYNRNSWDSLVAKADKWTVPVSTDAVAQARAGNWSIVLTPLKPVPRAWFPTVIHGLKVLCLASGGGQQGPVLAAAGATVTVLDNSPKQLEQDRLVAERETLPISTELGDMRDLSRFTDHSFDLVVHPVSNLFVESPLPVWQEAARVLKPGGTLLAGFANPLNYIFDLEGMNEGRLQVRHPIPYADAQHLNSDELQRLVVSKNEPVCFGHTLHDQIQGQIDHGFVIAGFYEDKSPGGPLDSYIDTYIATRAIKLSA